jgi:REP element-mobilizing transposase RayT
MTAVEVGGMADHVHVLLSLPSTISISKAMQLLKGGSSKWVHETFPRHWLFRWQVKYGAFGVSVSLLEKTIEYIKNQEAHHRKMTFQEEFWRCSRSIASRTTNATFGTDSQPSLRDSSCTTVFPQR